VGEFVTKPVCPGAIAFREPTPEILFCNRCKAENEIWSDEPVISCVRCGGTITRALGPSCLDWCKEAEACVGEKTLRAYREAKGRNRENPYKQE